MKFMNFNLWFLFTIRALKKLVIFLYLNVLVNCCVFNCLDNCVYRLVGLKVVALGAALTSILTIYQYQR